MSWKYFQDTLLVFSSFIDLIERKYIKYVSYAINRQYAKEENDDECIKHYIVSHYSLLHVQ